MALALIPGIEISQGQVVTCGHGTLEPQHAYGDPAAAAQRWIAQGARWLYVSDLDVLNGRGSNAAAVDATLHAARGHADVAFMGGVRDQASLDAAVKAGARQIVLDPAALADLDFVASALRSHPDRVSVGVVAHDGRLRADGSAVDGSDVFDLLQRVDALGCRAYVIDDIDSRGMRKTSQRALLVEACNLVRGAIIVAGGIERIDDLHALATLGLPGLSGVIIEHALYADSFSLAEAEAAIEPRFDPWIWAPPQP